MNRDERSQLRTVANAAAAEHNYASFGPGVVLALLDALETAERECTVAVDAFHRCRVERDEALATVTAERDELAATLANERGEGAPPSEGWRWDGSAWLTNDPDGSIVVEHKIQEIGWVALLHDDDGTDIIGEKPTARELMRWITEGQRAADAALRSTDV